MGQAQAQLCSDHVHSWCTWQWKVREDLGGAINMDLLMTVRRIMRRQSPTFNANRGLGKALLEADGVVGDCSPLGIAVFVCFG